MKFVHFVIGATEHPAGDLAKCAKDAVRYGLRAGRPIWGAGYDKRFCFDWTMRRSRAMKFVIIGSIFGIT